MFPQEVAIDGEKATVIWRRVAESADGGSIDAPGANFFRVVNSKIVYMSNHHDKGAFSPFTHFMSLSPDEKVQAVTAARLNHSRMATVTVRPVPPLLSNSSAPAASSNGSSTPSASSNGSNAPAASSNGSSAPTPTVVRPKTPKTTPTIM